MAYIFTYTHTQVLSRKLRPQTRSTNHGEPTKSLNVNLKELGTSFSFGSEEKEITWSRWGKWSMRLRWWAWRRYNEMMKYKKFSHPYAGIESQLINSHFLSVFFCLRCCRFEVMLSWINVVCHSYVEFRSSPHLFYKYTVIVLISQSSGTSSFKSEPKAQNTNQRWFESIFFSKRKNVINLIKLKTR